MKHFEIKITIEEDEGMMNRTCASFGYLSQMGKSAVLASVFRCLNIDPTTKYGDLLISLSKVIYLDDLESDKVTENTEDTEENPEF